LHLLFTPAFYTCLLTPAFHTYFLHLSSQHLHLLLQGDPAGRESEAMPGPRHGDVPGGGEETRESRASGSGAGRNGNCGVRCHETRHNHDRHRHPNHHHPDQHHHHHHQIIIIVVAINIVTIIQIITITIIVIIANHSIVLPMKQARLFNAFSRRRVKLLISGQSCLTSCQS
jgi:hypothetical protein